MRYLLLVLIAVALFICGCGGGSTPGGELPPDDDPVIPPPAEKPIVFSMPEIYFDFPYFICTESPNRTDYSITLKNLGSQTYSRLSLKLTFYQPFGQMIAVVDSPQLTSRLGRAFSYYNPTQSFYQDAGSYSFNEGVPQFGVNDLVSVNGLALGDFAPNDQIDVIFYYIAP